MPQHLIDEYLCLELPDTWEAWDSQDDLLFLAVAPDFGPDEVQPQFFITRGPSTATDPLAAAVGNAANLINMLGEDAISATENFESNGMNVASLTWNQETQGWLFTNIHYFLVTSGFEYQIACKMFPDQYDRWADDFEQVARSIRRIA